MFADGAPHEVLHNLLMLRAPAFHVVTSPSGDSM